MPYSGTERSLMIFYIKKRFQLVKMISLSTHIDIFEEKKFKFFFGDGWSKSQKFFRFNDVKSTEIFSIDIQIVAKYLVRGVLTNFIKKVPFWGPYIPLKHFSYPPLNFSCQGASFKHPFDFPHDFPPKKWENWSKLKNFVKIVLITHF